MASTQALLERAPTTTKVAQVLTAEFGPKKPLELGRIPDAAKADPKLPYGILYPLWENQVGGSARFPHADVEWVYQVSLYSTRVDQLEVMRDIARRVFLGQADTGAYLHDLDVPGVHIMWRRPTEEGGEPQPAGDLWSFDLRFALGATPRNT